MQRLGTLLALTIVVPQCAPAAPLPRQKTAVYYSGWQLIGQRFDQPTVGDTRNLTRINELVRRGFTHVMMYCGNMEVNGAVQPLDTLQFLGQRGLASYMNVGLSWHTFYEDTLPVSVRRSLSPFSNRTGYQKQLQAVERIIRAASPWLAGIMNDLEFPPWESDFPDLDERLGNRPSASVDWPSFVDWPTPGAHKLPANSNWTLEKLFFNMPQWTHNDGGRPGSTGAVLRIAGTPGESAGSMVAQLFRPAAPTLARMDLWLRLTSTALPKLPYLSYYVAPLLVDGTPDTDHPVLCAIPRPKPDILPYATGKYIKCGVHASELAALVAPNATQPLLPNSSSWQPIKLVRCRPGPLQAPSLAFTHAADTFARTMYRSSTPCCLLCRPVWLAVSDVLIAGRPLFTAVLQPSRSTAGHKQDLRPGAPELPAK